MALSNYEKQKRWREKNRALYNLRQREYRKNRNLGGGATTDKAKARTPEAIKADGQIVDGQRVVDQAPSLFQTKKVGELRMLVMPEEKKEEITSRPMIYRNDYGGVISKYAWEKLQETKRKSKEGGYILDEYSQ